MLLEFSTHFDININSTAKVDFLRFSNSFSQILNESAS